MRLARRAVGARQKHANACRVTAIRLLMCTRDVKCAVGNLASGIFAVLGIDPTLLRSSHLGMYGIRALHQVTGSLYDDLKCPALPRVYILHILLLVCHGQCAPDEAII